MGQYSNVTPEHAAALAAVLQPSRDYYVEEGMTVGADSAARPVWCVLDARTHEQVGESFSTPELANLVAKDWNGD